MGEKRGGEPALGVRGGGRMNALDDPLMESLVVICRADDFSPQDYDMLFRVPTPDDPKGFVVAKVRGEDFDALVARGWIELVGEDEFQATQQGKYWYDRWESREEKRRRYKGLKRAPKRLTGHKR